MLLRKLVFVAMLAFSASVTAASADQPGSAASIEHLMMSMFNRPDAPLKVQPVTIDGDIAVAGWAQGDMGGRALLRQQNGNWVLVLCSGDALKDPKSLQTFGLPVDQAERLASAVAAAESSIDPALLKKFASFDGVVMMSGDGGHPPADTGSGGQK